MTVLLSTASTIRPQIARSDWVTFNDADGLHAGAPAGPGLLAEDADGSVWMGGHEVARYDGLRFVNFNESDNLKLGEVHGLVVTTDGTVWAGTALGLVHYSLGNWRDVDIPMAASQNITCLLYDRAGLLWAGTVDGLFFLDSSGWHSSPTGLSGRIVDLLEDSSGAIWAASSATLSRRDTSGWRPFTPPPNQSITALTQDPQGTIWVATAGAGLYRFAEPATWVLTQDSRGKPAGAADVMADPDGFLWIAGDGVTSYHPESHTWRSYSVIDGLPHQSVQGVARTSDGAMWFWDYYGGFSRFDRSAWQLFGTESGLQFAFGTALSEDVIHGSMWCGTYWGGLHRYDGTSWTRYTAGFPADDRANCLHVDRSGKLWAGTGVNGICFMGADSSVHFLPTPLTGTRVNCIFEDDSSGASAIWFGTNLGVRRLDLRDSSWASLDSTIYGRLGDVMSILRERGSGELWIATSEHGAYIRHAGMWEKLTTVPNGSEYVQRVLQASNGDLWIGSKYDGVARMSQGVWRVYTMADGLLDNGVSDMVEDSRGGILISSNTGVSRFYRGQWGRLPESNVLLNPGDILIAKSGAIWFATNNGLSRCDPDYVAPHTRVVANSSYFISGDRLQTIAFTIGFKENPATAQFSYCLDCPSLDDTAWSTWSPTPFWIDSNVPDTASGARHVLAIKSRDEAGNVDALPALVTFEIDATPPIPVISQPYSGAPVRGSTPIVASTADPRYLADTLWVRAVGDSLWKLVASSTTPLTADTLAWWDTVPLRDGPYEVRLSVTDSLGLMGSSIVRVFVDNNPPDALITAPARVTASGGDVYTTNEEVHLYFPPQAFRNEATVSITPLLDSAVDDTLDSGSIRVFSGYHISWEGDSIRKPARMVLRYPDTLSANGLLALYHRGEGGVWNHGGHCGGRLDRIVKTISLPIDSAGDYAVFEDFQPVLHDGSLSSLSFAPRVFSPTGGFADSKVSIGFTLGRPAPVTVRVYSRSGRLVKELISGETLNSGANLVTWDGRSGSGGQRIVPDGLYLVTVQALGATRKQTLAVVR